MSDSTARHNAASLAAAWRKQLHALGKTAEDQGMTNVITQLTERALDAFERASSPFADLPSAVKPYGNRFESPDPEPGERRKMPQSARRAMELRDSFFQFAIIRGLTSLGSATAAGGADEYRWEDILKHLVSTALAQKVPIVVAAGPTADKEQGFQWADYAGSARAHTFFSEELKRELGDLDRSLGTQLTDLLPQKYDRTDQDSINHYGRVWTAAVAMVLVDWIRQHCDNTLDPTSRQLADALWSGIKNPRGHLVKFYPGNAVLPTSNKVAPGLQIILTLQTLLAQALEYDDSRWTNPPGGRPIRIRVHELNLLWRDNRAFYRALNGGHLYFAILAACLGEPTEGGVVSNSIPPSLDARLHVLTAPQERCLRAMDETRNAAPRPNRRIGYRFLGNSLDEAAASIRNVPPAIVGAIWDGAVDFQPSPAENAADDHDIAEIGTIELWPNLPTSVGWFDMLFVAEHMETGDRWILPLEVTELSPQNVAQQDAATDSPSHALLLTDQANALASPAALRHAFATPGGTHWRYEYAGLGVFIVVVVEL